MDMDTYLASLLEMQHQSEHNKRLLHSLVKENNSDMKEESKIAVYSDNPYLKKAFLYTLYDDGYTFNLNDIWDRQINWVFDFKNGVISSCGIVSNMEAYYLDTKWTEALSKVRKLYKFYNQPTYEIGDRFWSEQMDCVFLLACVDYDRKINLINIERGSRLGDAIEVNDIYNVNKKDFDKVCKGYKLEKL